MIDILNYTFFQNALWAILLISITSAIIGTYIVARRMLFITGGITHASFGGLGVGYYLGHQSHAFGSCFRYPFRIGSRMAVSGQIGS